MEKKDYPEIIAHGYKRCLFDEDDANHLIALDFQERAHDFLQALDRQVFPKYKTPVDISFQFVSCLEEPSLGLDIFVTPISKANCHAFCIVIPIKVVSHLTSIFTALEVGPKRVETGVAASDIGEEVFRKIYLRSFAALSYVFFHEFSHVQRAHIPFLYPVKYQSRKDLEFLSLGQVKKPHMFAKSRSRFDLHRAIELDADLLAIQYIIEFVSNNNFGKFFSFSSDWFDNPRVFGSSIYIFMQLLELWRQTIHGPEYVENSLHPHPDIRAIFVEALIMMKAEQDTKENYQFEKEFVEGMKDAATQRDQLGPEFLPEFSYLEKKGIDAAMEEYDVLREDLISLKESLSRISVL